jgi:hypothetical protein
MEKIEYITVAPTGIEKARARMERLLLNMEEQEAKREAEEKGLPYFAYPKGLREVELRVQRLKEKMNLK